MIPYQELKNKRFSIGETLVGKAVEDACNYVQTFIGKRVWFVVPNLDTDTLYCLRNLGKPIRSCIVQDVCGFDRDGAIQPKGRNGGVRCCLARFTVESDDGIEWALKLGSHEAFSSEEQARRFVKHSKAMSERFFYSQANKFIEDLKWHVEEFNGICNWFLNNREELGDEKGHISVMIENFREKTAGVLNKMTGLQTDLVR